MSRRVSFIGLRPSRGPNLSSSSRTTRTEGVARARLFPFPDGPAQHDSHFEAPGTARQLRDVYHHGDELLERCCRVTPPIRTPPSSSGLASRLSRAVNLGTTIVPGPPLVLGRRRRGREAARRGTWPAPRRTRPRRAGRLPVWGAAQGSPGRGGEAQGRLARHLFPVQVAVGAVEEDEIFPLDIEDECLCVVDSAAPTPPRRKGCAGGRRRGWSWSPRPRRFKTNRRPRTGTKPTRGRGGEAGQVRVTRSSPASCSRSRR